jgi:hypothetical protein
VRVHERDILRSADRVLGDKGPAVTIRRDMEISGDVLAEQPKLSYLVSVDDREDAAAPSFLGGPGGVCHAGGEGDIAEVELIRLAEAGNKTALWVNELSSSRMPPAPAANVVLPIKPPPSTSSLPPLIIVPLAIPPDATISKPPLLTIVPVVTPPPETISPPRLPTIVPLATPPVLTYSRPLLRIVPVVTPPRETISMPPPYTTVPLATPPEQTTSSPPQLTIAPLATPPEETISRPSLMVVSIAVP